MSAVCCLSALTHHQISQFLLSFDTVLVDCDGVLWSINTPLPGSLDVIKSLQDLNKRVFLVSNNATLTRKQYVAKLSHMGHAVRQEDIIIPSVVVASYLQQHGFEKKAFVIGCKAFVQTLEAEGIQCTSIQSEMVEGDVPAFISHLRHLDTDIGAVIVDYDPHINYIRLMQAVTLLKRGDCLFLIGATDYTVPLTSDISLLGPGYFVSILEAATCQKGVELGKPSSLVLDAIREQHAIDPQRTLVIGDSMAQDIMLATRCGLQSLLVLSGLSTLEDATKDPHNRPHYYLKTLGDLLPLITQHRM